MNSDAIKTKKNLCERSLGILVHHYFISLKDNIWKFERCIGLLTSYILPINYESYMDQMLIFGSNWAQNTILPIKYGAMLSSIMHAQNADCDCNAGNWRALLM